jgi:hypothetical protein
MYMVFHFIYSTVTMSIAYFSMFNEVLCIGLILVNGWWCLWSGANYYMEYFSRNNENRLKSLEKMNEFTD